MADSIQNSINSVIFSANNANTLNLSATTSLLQNAFAPNIPQDLAVTNAEGTSIALSTLLATNNTNSSIFSSLTGGSSVSNLLATSYGNSSSLNSVLASSFNTSGTDIDLLI